MKLIVPMAGRGTRLRPHSHVTPKPLIHICGRSMVERIIETIAEVLTRDLEEAVFILGPDFGYDVREQLSEICERRGMRASFEVQERPLGTAHAVFQADAALAGECVIIFADTLFTMDEPPDLIGADALIWVKHVDDPRRFGVVLKDDAGTITDFVEKPSEPISNEAIIGIYYVRDGAGLRREIQYLIDNEVKGAAGEFQLTDALDRMLKGGAVFRTASVSEWLDAGTIQALLDTTRVILDKEQGLAQEGTVEDSVVHGPSYVGPGAVVRGSEIGPYVAIHEGARVYRSTLRDTIVFAHADLSECQLRESVVGRHVALHGAAGRFNVGDHSEVEAEGGERRAEGRGRRAEGGAG
jgi:glucose-1-phosphate thymidylyltransferase